MFFDPLLYTFVFLGLFSPGPNVIMLTASGARFGFVRSLPHLFGVVLGVGITAGITAFGVGALILANPGLAMVLRVLAAAWIVYMAWNYFKATRGPRAEVDDAGQPMRFWQAVLFQWINPKVWAIAFAASAGYGAGWPALWEGARLGVAFSGVNLGVCLFWTSAGALLTTLLTSPLRWKIFMRIMAALLALSALMVFR
ncbi:LysE family translocator [Roseicitreum antarcticum]|uniref:Threonine/homoserine/homoserine lactone efflux protein n=1 Tax=Roseicitreum antarcticum TaxID=564137 RepID=A0A1H2ZS77_9RHOB|nr:LysE family translocator [Roseicitreum antarcticum]SDX19529.1 Threonine/homoserine/homoserine lactone efflux protein [Roseicitreum antarcticum]